MRKKVAEKSGVRVRKANVLFKLGLGIINNILPITNPKKSKIDYLLGQLNDQLKSNIDEIKETSIIKIQYFTRKWLNKVRFKQYQKMITKREQERKNIKKKHTKKRGIHHWRKSK
mmetsp:Transcript_28890/g.25557  ORF Transcript_28890/g.25557 Transcript_28890/m.25557 type:complete len:115 (+) Transcript_28890:570-914(+)